MKSRILAALWGGMMILLAVPANSQVVVVPPPAINISDTPLFLTVSVSPNLVVTIDDSGSMKRGYTQDICGSGTDDCANLDNRFWKATRHNPMYYNPAIAYPKARRENGTEIDTSFTAALQDGFDSTLGTVNLSNDYRPTAFLNHGQTSLATQGYMGHYASDSRCTTSAPYMCQIRTTNYASWQSGATACVGATSAVRETFCDGPAAGSTPGVADTVPGGVPAYYYLFDGTRVGCDGTNTDNDCYRIVLVTSTSGPGSTDERQNFANWYSFSRTRNLATQTAASLAFVDLDPNVRVGWQAMNSCRGSSTSLPDDDCDGWRQNFTGVTNRVRPFTGTHRQNFYNWIAQLPTINATPAPVAMNRAGEYFRTSGENSPYDNDFSTPNSGMHSCRRNYHILMTDGIWNSTVSIGNTDNGTIVLPEVATEPEPDVTRYEPIRPYLDASSNTLADVALRYSLMDLNPTLGNNLLPIYRDRSGNATQQFWNPRNDPYTWQHMVNYTIGLGLTHFIAASGLTWDGNMYGGSYPSLVSGAASWPAASTAAPPGNIADLWHAALNSRGQFFSADNPAALSNAFRESLIAITSDAGSSAALSTNSTSIQPGTTVVYQAKFSRGWTGTLLALPVAANGSVGSQIWDASQNIPAWASRNIFSYDGSSGVDTSQCSDLNVAQQAYLNRDGAGTFDGLCEQRLEWLRGDPSREQRNGGPFRNRPDTVMGDVINSDPAYVKNINYGFGNLPAGTPGRDSYAGYVTANDTRKPMVYVGANDGLMHAFDADNGVEEFAFMPIGVFHNLSKLTSPTYAHKFYADGGITASDAMIGGNWHSVLVAGLNSGGRTVYALDVTDPENFDVNDVMWEYFEPDMGLTYSQPQIGVLENGRWIVAFGNGYNSPSGGAILYILDLESGALIAKLVASDTAGDEGNGLSTPLLYDSDNNHMIDHIYAGDLHGNMWVFDVSGPVGDLKVGLAGSPLFTARNTAGQVQQITAQPKAAPGTFGGTIVLFGTGQYLTVADVSNGDVQTFYGIHDDGVNPVLTTDRSELQRQEIDLQTNAFGRQVRSVTGFAPNWGVQRGWYLDFQDPSNVGERIISTPLVKEDRVIFITAVPSTDPCRPGGSSWLMELNFMTGGTFDEAILDLNNDGEFNALDNASGQVVSGVHNEGLGISKTPVWLQATPNSAFKIMTGTSGSFASERNRTAVPPPPGGGAVRRRSWIQIR